MSLQKYSERYLDSVYHALRNRNPWYGIMFKVSNLRGSDICIMVERGFENLYFGVTLVQNGIERQLCDSAEFNDLAASVIPNCTDPHRKGGWMGTKGPTKHVNFEKFADENTLMLANKEYRAEYLRRFVNELKQFILDSKLRVEGV
jgi:hypothetical protein